MRTKNCAVCGAPFEIIPHGTNKLYCSNECRKKAHREQAKKHREERKPPSMTHFLTVTECHLCRSCKWAGKANGGAATVSCDYAFRTGELRGCEVSEHCERYEAQGRRGKE